MAFEGEPADQAMLKAELSRFLQQDDRRTEAA
jgi:hypothetical protein